MTWPFLNREWSRRKAVLDAWSRANATVGPRWRCPPARRLLALWDAGYQGLGVYAQVRTCGFHPCCSPTLRDDPTVRPPFCEGRRIPLPFIHGVWS